MEQEEKQEEQEKVEHGKQVEPAITKHQKELEQKQE